MAIAIDPTLEWEADPRPWRGLAPLERARFLRARWTDELRWRASFVACCEDQMDRCRRDLEGAANEDGFMAAATSLWALREAQGRNQRGIWRALQTLRRLDRIVAALEEGSHAA